jgi:tetratricopeptide (TPR) repeat protein
MTPPKTTLTLCVIAKNEERFIERCLSSVKDVVDEMIVVDTGSEDRTPHLAAGLGAQVSVFPWTGDFAEARNHAIGKATGDWILFLDADEMLAQRDAERLRQWIASTRADGLKLIQRTYLRNANYVCASTNPRDYEEGREFTDCINVGVIRLFRNDTRIRYSGRVHELVEPAFVSNPGLSFQVTELVIHHFGKVGDSATLEAKKLLYLDLGRKKVTDDPSNALAQFELGVQLYELERFSECLEPFQEAVKLNPAFDLALLYVAKALHLLGRMDEAGHWFQKCLKRSPNNDKVLFDYANFVRDRGDNKAALKLYQRTIAANPGHALALFNMGVLRVRTGDSSLGLSLIERALRLNPANSIFYENLGRLAMAFPDLLAATHHLENYVERFPEAWVCVSVLAEVHFKNRQFGKSIEMADRAMALGAPRPRMLLTKANANFSLRRIDEAEESYRSALQLEPANLDGMMNLAAIAEIREDHAAARSWYLRILDAYPGQSLALKRLAAAQTRSGLDAEAADALDRACAVHSADPQSLVLVGSLFEQAGRYERAVELYRSAASKKPEWTATMNRRVEKLKSGHNQERSYS